MPKRNGQGETKAHTESGEEEAKGGENVQKINREDVVQAALIVERWCAEHCNGFICLENGDCPFANEACYLNNDVEPGYWRLEEFLRTRGLKHE